MRSGCTESPIPHCAEFGPRGRSRWLVVERRLRVEVCGESSYLRYEGAFPCMHWWVSSEILYWILNETGSQWSEWRMGVMWLYFLTLIRILVLFCMYWSFWRLKARQVYYMAPFNTRQFKVLEHCKVLESDEESVAVVDPWGDEGMDQFFILWQGDTNALAQFALTLVIVIYKQISSISCH